MIIELEPKSTDGEIIVNQYGNKYELVRSAIGKGNKFLIIIKPINTTGTKLIVDIEGRDKNFTVRFNSNV